MDGRKSIMIFLSFSAAALMAVAWVAVCAAESNLINCDINRRGCTRILGEHEIELEITPIPVSAMEELTFRVHVTGPKLPGPPFIDLGMPGMEMGPNRVVLEETAPSVYEGTGVIVRCPSGKTIWRATVTVPDAGSSDFIFDVAY